MKVHLTHALRIAPMAAALLVSSPGSSRGADQAASRAESATFFVINYRAGPNWKPGVPMSGQGLRDHFQYVKSLDESGRIAVAGPVGSDAGLILLRAANQAEADRVIAGDPAVKAGLFVGKAQPFVPTFVGKMPMSPVKPR